VLHNLSFIDVDRKIYATDPKLAPLLLCIWWLISQEILLCHDIWSTSAAHFAEVIFSSLSQLRLRPSLIRWFADQMELFIVTAAIILFLFTQTPIRNKEK